MNKVIATGLMLYSLSALAQCPDITGTYTCSAVENNIHAAKSTTLQIETIQIEGSSGAALRINSIYNAHEVNSYSEGKSVIYDSKELKTSYWGEPSIVTNSCDSQGYREELAIQTDGILDIKSIRKTQKGISIYSQYNNEKEVLTEECILQQKS